MCTNPRKIWITKTYEGINGEKPENCKEQIIVPCGKCDTCRKKRASEWAIKLQNEAKYHKECCFITLTFSNEILLNKNSKAVKEYGAQANFPYNINYSKKYFQKFMKRLRKKFPNKKITFYHIGEYGELKKRAHHHVLLFGCDFHEDAKEAELSKSGKPQFFSQTLEELWGCGRTRFQKVNPNNIIYISGYSVKKYKKKDDRYKETQTFSNRSKMSCKWIRKNPQMLKNMYLEDIEKKRYPIPKSYIKEMKKEYEKKENPVYIHEYSLYSDRLEDFICNIDNKELIQQQKIKEEIRQIRNSHKFRDF